MPLAETITATYIRTLIRQRRARSNIVSAFRFADPAWDLLLDLTAARLEGRAISISSACNAANVPPTTALRCIDKLVGNGVLVREPVARDARSSTLTTADHVHEAMLTYLNEHAEKLVSVYFGAR